MDEVMTIEEIDSRFPSEWVLLADPKVDQYGRVVGGRVVCHSRDRDEVDQLHSHLSRAARSSSIRWCPWPGLPARTAADGRFPQRPDQPPVIRPAIRRLAALVASDSFEGQAYLQGAGVRAGSGYPRRDP